MSVLILKPRMARARAVALPPAGMSAVTRAAGLAMGAGLAGSVFSAGWAVAGLALKALG